MAMAKTTACYSLVRKIHVFTDKMGTMYSIHICFAAEHCNNFRSGNGDTMIKHGVQCMLLRDFGQMGSGHCLIFLLLNSFNRYFIGFSLQNAGAAVKNMVY